MEWSLGVRRSVSASSFALLQAALVLLSSSAAAGADPVRVAEINPSGTFASWPSHFCRSGDRIFFFQNAYTAPVLWQSDGSASGTRTVREIPLHVDIPGATSWTDVSLLTPFDGGVYFLISHSVQDYDVLYPASDRVWRSDGTTEGTYDIFRRFPDGPAGNVGRVHDIATLGNRVVFVFSSTQDTQLWSNDGRPVGTHKIQSVSRQRRHGSELFSYRSRAYFTVGDLEHGRELWATDGTRAGTALVRNINPDGDSVPHGFAEVAGALFFAATHSASGTELWKSDGTAAGTELVADVRPGAASSAPTALTDVNGTLFFTADGGPSGRELWRSEGTAESTTLVRDIHPEMDTLASPQLLTPFRGGLFFLADDGVHGSEVWVSDGTAVGTRMLTDFVPGPDGVTAKSLLSLGDSVLFVGNDPVSNLGAELWRIDARSEGVSLVKDIREGPSGSICGALGVVLEESVYFGANDGVHGCELWRTAGSKESTSMVKDLESDRSGSIPQALRAVGDRVYFVADDGIHGRELWVTDGSAAGTVLVADVHRGRNATGPAELGRLGEDVFFFGPGNELWKSDGSADGTVAVTSLPTAPRRFTSLGDALYFVIGRTLWRSDGTGGGTVEVASFPEFFAGLTSGERLLFVVNGRTLWRSDGTAEGTFLLHGALRSQLAVTGNRVFFAAENEDFGTELWVSDGTESGTTLLDDLQPGQESSWPKHLSIVDDTLFFFADAASNDRTGLWKSDGSAGGSRFVSSLRAHTFFYSETAVVNGELFFTTQRFHGSPIDLWKSNGTAAGTVRLADGWRDLGFLLPDGPREFINVDGVLYFVGERRETGWELWRSDGTTEGTELVRDFSVGPDSSFPRELVVAGGKLFFSALDDDFGRTLWVVNPEPFVRGDVNADSGLDAADAMSILLYLFDGARITCRKTADVDDDGAIHVNDAIYLLNSLFRGGPAPAPPQGACGTDAATDRVSCAEYTACS